MTTAAYFMSEVASALYSLRVEIFVFISAFCAHALLFGKYRFLLPRKQVKSATSGLGASPPQSPQKPKKIQVTAEDICRTSASLSAGPGLKSEDVSVSLRNHLAAAPTKDVASALLELLQGAGRMPPAEFLAAASVAAKEHTLPLNAALGEALLRGYYAVHSDSEFDILLAEIEVEALGKGEPLANTIRVQALKGALRKGDFEGALGRLVALRSMWEAEAASGTENSPSAAPKALLQWLARLAVQQDCVPKMVQELKALSLFAVAFPFLLTECAQHGSPDLLRQTEALGRKEGLAFTGAAYCALMRNADGVEHAMSIFKEAIETAGVSKELFAAAASIAFTHKSTSFADAILKKLQAGSCAEGAGKLLQVYASSEVLSLYLEYFSEVDLSGDATTEQVIAKACVQSNRIDVLKKMLSTTTDCTKRVALIKQLGVSGNLDGAFVVFRAFDEHGACLYNAIIDACIDGRRPQAAKEMMEEAIKAGVADTVTYNTIIKANLLAGNTAEAQQTVKLMKAAGFQPNCVTFNELLDACIKCKIQDVWPIFDEMEACAVKPNHITGSILLKTIRSDTPAKNVERVLQVLDSLVEEMDEVLLSSVVEACIRAGRVDLLLPHLKRQTSSKRIQVQGPHTYGSIIRAYGYVNDIPGAWETWREMRRRHIVPSAVTLGCMVEAVVSNGDAEAGYELIQDMLHDEQCQPLVNAVIYCSVLKGFSRQRKFDRLWDVYQEMLVYKCQFSIVTFNTMIDACSRNGEMKRIGPLVESMVSQGIEPNLITYSAILKGYCQDNHLEEAYQLMETCKAKFKPDEIMYNSLLDGYARQGLYDSGIVLLREMEASGINPSNFTLSVLVKLCSRAKRVDRAFEIVTEITTKYRFKPNVHVYSNLIQASIQHKDLKRGFEVFEEMLSARVRPEARTYSLLLRACVAERQPQEAAGLIRAAVGLRGVHPRLMGYNASALQPQGSLPPVLVSEILEGISGHCSEERLAVALLKDLRSKTNIKLDAKLQMRLTTHAVCNKR